MSHRNLNVQRTLNRPTGDTTIEVRANAIVYFGQIRIPTNPRDRDIELKYVKKREIESWKMVLDKYSDSPWATMIDEHIKNLE